MKKLKINMVSESEISVRGHGVHTAYVELVKALKKRSDCGLVVNDFTHKTSADVMHLHTVGLHAFRKLVFGKAKAKAVSAHVVPASFVGSIAFARLWLPLAKVYLSWFYGRADRVFAVSEMVAKILERDLNIPKDKITVLYNSIDTSQYKNDAKKRRAARKKLNIRDDEFVVVGNGQVQPRKRVDTFVKLARTFPDVRFFWVGGISFKYVGADYQKMQALTKSIPSNMNMTGVIELDRVKSYLWAADLFILPAEQENHPMAVIEAAAAGLPIILRDIPEYKDTFAGNVLLAQDDSAFTSLLKEIRADNSMRKLYSKKSAEIARRFDSSIAADKLMSMYKKMVTV